MKIYSNFLKNNKHKSLILILLAFTGISAILLSYVFHDNTGNEYIQTSENAYADILEGKTQRIIESITGSGTAKVMITLKNTYLLQNNSEDNNVFLKTSTEEQQPPQKIPLPDIAGVMIVCTKLDNREDLETVKHAVATCLGIHTSKIYIIGGSTNEKNN